jgi:hypothetical protein
MTTTTPCILWRGTLDWTGYGRVSAGNDRGKLAHRVALEQKLGRPIAPGLQCNHTCDVKACINPDHLYEGTQKQNIADSIARHRHFSANKTHCPHGHPYAGDNLYTAPTGARQCRTCKHERRRRYRLQRKASA